MGSGSSSCIIFGSGIGRCGVLFGGRVENTNLVVLEAVLVFVVSVLLDLVATASHVVAPYVYSQVLLPE